MSINPIEYVQTRKDETVVDEYFGHKVADPYRWLEDDRSEETGKWITAQNTTTQSFLKQIPFTGKLVDQMKDAWNYERYGSPTTEGNYVYWFKNDGLQNQSVLYRKKVGDEDGSSTEIFLDPNTWSEKGTSSLATLEFTEDGSICVYYISHAGSDLRVARFLNCETKEQIEAEELTNIKFSGASWYKNEGIFYSKYYHAEGESVLTAKTDSHRVFYHKLGSKQCNDVLIFGHLPDQKRRYVFGAVTDDNEYLVVTAAESTSGNELYIKKLTPENVPNDQGFVQLINSFEHDFDMVDELDGQLYIITNHSASNKKLLKFSIEAFLKFQSTPPADYSAHFIKYPQFYTEIIPEVADAVLEVTRAGKYFIANYSRIALSAPVQFTMNGEKVRDIELPTSGTAGGFSEKRQATAAYYSFTSYINPNTIYKFDLESGVSTVHFAPKVDVDGMDKFVSKRVFYPSKDGTQIPMIITYHPEKVDLSTGLNPLQLYGYGGFNISLSPAFSIPTAVWVANGGIYAVPNLRGGGENGKTWHTAGTKFQKQNVFDDFIAAAEYLIQEKYTTKDLIVSRGGSNGGLLIGATLTQRPDLFRVAIPMVGVLDMLRYHTSTAGQGWSEDYLNSEISEEAFKYLYGYSPVHNVKDGTTYPAVMITTADHDDRVVPFNSFKFAAELQARSANAATPAEHLTSPVIIRIDVDAGHGAGKSVAMLAQEHADIQAFALFCMGRSL